MVLPVLKVLGPLLLLFAGALGIPGLYDFASNGNSYPAFLLPAAAGAVLAAGLFVLSRHADGEFTHRHAYLLVTLGWLTVCSLGALPYYLAGSTLSWIDALFESVSGFTGTGASVFADVEALPECVLLWRSLSQWLGGMGIMIFLMAILPALGVGGVELFRAEATGPQKDRITPRVRETAKRLLVIYAIFTVVLGLLLHFAAGLSPFDAVNHALTTLSTGGFSTKNQGIAAFQSPLVDYLLVIFMLAGSINFSLHYRAIARRDRTVLRDTELRWYLGLVAGAAGLLTVLSLGDVYVDFTEAFRHTLFVVVSTASSTGFSHADYTVWPVAAQFVLLALTVMGAMSGSTGGGMKCVRVVAALKQLFKELRQVIHPRAVFAVRVNQRPVPPAVIEAVWGFLFLYLLVFIGATLLLTLTKLDLVTAASATLSALSNVGPALGSLGPTAHFASLSDFAKAVLSFCMLVGRLEFYSVLVLLIPSFWRR